LKNQVKKKGKRCAKNGEKGGPMRGFLEGPIVIPSWKEILRKGEKKKSLVQCVREKKKKKMLKGGIRAIMAFRRDRKSKRGGSIQPGEKMAQM